MIIATKTAKKGTNEPESPPNDGGEKGSQHGWNGQCELQEHGYKSNRPGSRKRTTKKKKHNSDYDNDVGENINKKMRPTKLAKIMTYIFG